MASAVGSTARLALLIIETSRREEGWISGEYLLAVPFDPMGGGCGGAECPGTLFLLALSNVAEEGNGISL